MKFKKKKLQIKCKQILNNNRINKLKKKSQILKKKQSKKILIFYRNMIVFAII